MAAALFGCALAAAAGDASAAPRGAAGGRTGATPSARRRTPKGVAPPARATPPRLGPPQPRRVPEPGGRKAKSELVGRAWQGDRVLAEYLAARWDQFPPGISVERRVEAILGETIPWAPLHALREANPDLLGAARSGRVKFTPEVRGRMRALLDEHASLTYDELARRFERDPLLGRVQRRWQGDEIARTVARFPADFERRSSEARVEHSPELWTDVRAALMAQPSQTHDAVAAALARDRRFAARHPGVRPTRLLIKALIARHEGADLVAAARDRALAEAVAARLTGVPHESSLAAVQAALGAALPRVSRARLTSLRDSFPELLGAWSWERSASGLGAAEARRVEQLALAHPTLGVPELVELFRADPALGHLDWTVNRGRYLQQRGRGIIPAAPAREAALARLVVAAGKRQPAGAGVEALVGALAADHPRFTLETLGRLARRDPEVARLVARARVREAGADLPVAALDPAAVRRVALPRAQLERALAQDGSPLRAALLARVADAERTVGDHDGRLSPRDLARADAPTRAVMEALYERLGRHALPLEAIDQALPAAIVTVATRARRGRDAGLRALDLAATGEAIEGLSLAYRREVVEGATSAGAFAAGRGLHTRDWVRLRGAFPGAFPEPGAAPLEGERLDTIAALYGRVLAGEATPELFYARTGVTREQVRLLQATEPARFPRPPRASAKNPLAGVARAPLDERRIGALSAEWRSRVLTREITAHEFYGEHGLSPATVDRLRRERPGDFPGFGDAGRPLRPGEQRNDEAAARAVAASARAAIASDVLASRADVVRAITADGALEAQVGALAESRYNTLQKKFPGLFPRIGDPAAVLPALAAEVKQLLADRPDLGPKELSAELRRRHPRFADSRIAQLRAAYPGLIPRVLERAAAPGRREADARRLAARLAAEPGLGVAGAGDALAASEPRFGRGYVSGLRKDFPGIFVEAGAGPTHQKLTERRSRPMQELFALTVRLAPPGTTEAELAGVLNGLLVERGLPPYDEPRSVRSQQLLAPLGLPDLEEQGARVAAGIVAEYARAAPRGASEAEVLERVRRDYPTLRRDALSRYRRRWEARPADFPALAALRARRGGALALSGRGERVGRGRYLGGWDVERAVLGDPAAEAELAQRAQNARIPLRLPLLDELVRDLDGGRPLQSKNVLWVSHLLGSTYPLARALQEAGLSARGTVVVGTPYGTNEQVRAALADEGFDVRVPSLSTAAYRAEVERAVADVVARHRDNGRSVVVLDDGGLVTEILHATPAYADVLPAFKIVEQTTRGVTAAEQRPLKVPVVNVARSRAKRAEGALIGRAVAAKVLQGLRRSGRELGGARAVVLGYGVIGAAIARELERAGARVTVVERGAARAVAARRAGFTTAEARAALAEAQVVIGATGATSLGVEELRLLPSGAVVASASSKQVEIDMAGLARAAARRTPIDPGSPLVRLPTARYRLGRKELTVLGDGWPVNFDGDVEDLPPEEIQLTRAAMFAGALQAASLRARDRTHLGLVELDPAVDRRLVERFRALGRRGGAAAPIGDPEGWRDAVRQLARRLPPPAGS